MSFSGHIPRFRVDWNSLRDRRIGTLLTHSPDWLQEQIVPPSVGSVVVVIGEDGDEHFAEVTERSGIWLGLVVS